MGRVAWREELTTFWGRGHACAGCAAVCASARAPSPMSSATSGSRGFRGPRPPCRGAAGFSLGGGRRASGNALLSSQSSKMRRIASRGRHRSGRTHSSARRGADVFEAPMRNATRCAGASRAGITWFCSFACAGRKDSPPGGQQSHSTPKAGLCLIVRRTILQAGQARARTTIVTRACDAPRL